MSIVKAIEDIQKRFPGSIRRLGDSVEPISDIIPTGCPSLDKALGIGGIPRGRITEIYGTESAGKSTVCLHIIAEAQKKGGNVAYIDTEYAFDKEYARNLGVDVDNLLVSQPDCAQDVLEIIEALVNSNEVSCIIVDSVAAMVTQEEINGDFGDAIVGVMARLMSQACRKLTSQVSKSNTALIFVNQIRNKIGISYGSNETTTGGNALKFYSSVRLDIRRVGQIKKGDEVIGSRTKVKVVKNKMAPPFKVVEFDIMYGEGISKEADLLDIAIESGVIVQKGAWFSHSGANFAQGRDNARISLKNPEFYDTILNECRILQQQNN